MVTFYVDVICERGDYGKGAVRCAALARHVSRALLQLASPHHLMTLWSELFSWTGNQQVRPWRGVEGTGFIFSKVILNEV